MYLGEQFLHRETFNPSDTAVFIFSNIYHCDIKKLQNKYSQNKHLHPYKYISMSVMVVPNIFSGLVP